MSNRENIEPAVGNQNTRQRFNHGATPIPLDLDQTSSHKQTLQQNTPKASPEHDREKSL